MRRVWSHNHASCMFAGAIHQKNKDQPGWKIEMTIEPSVFRLSFEVRSVRCVKHAMELSDPKTLCS